MIEKITAMRDNLTAEIEDLQKDRELLTERIETLSGFVGQLNELLGSEPETPFDLPGTQDAPERQPRRNMQRVLRVLLEKSGAAGVRILSATEALVQAFGRATQSEAKRALDGLVDNKIAATIDNGNCWVLAMYAPVPATLASFNQTQELKDAAVSEGRGFSASPLTAAD